jgi:hypothetical protein
MDKEDPSDKYKKLDELIAALRKTLGVGSEPIYTDKKQRLQLLQDNPGAIIKLRFPEPSEDEMLLAFSKKAELAIHFHTIPLAVQQFLIEQNPKNIQYIRDTTLEIELAAIYWQGIDKVDLDIYWLIVKPHYLTTLSAFKLALLPDSYELFKPKSTREEKEAS